MTRVRRLALVALLGVLGTFVLAAAPALADTFDVAAHTSVDRTYSWTISKVAHTTGITLTPGGSFTESYDVTVTPKITDSNWKVSDGIHYASDNAFTPVGVSAIINPGAIVPTVGDAPDGAGRCADEFGSSVNDIYCGYAASLPDGSARAVTATINLQGGGSVSTTTNFDFTNPTFLNEFGAKCVTVTDTLKGVLGTQCAADGPKTYSYTYTITAPSGRCGDFDVSNVASLNDDPVHPSSAGAIVHVHVPCAGGCTLTIGYWKNHAGFGPQADKVTPLLPQWLGTSGGAKSIKVTTAALAVQLLSFNGSNNVFAASNGINKLYAQLLAAKLNIANGANGSSVASTIAAADAFLANNNSLSWAGLTKAQQATVNGWMSALDDYNNGASGPGHCDDV
jgi:hypothetical protein